MLISNAVKNSIIHVPKSSSVFRFGVAKKPALTFRDSLSVHDGEAWAIVGSSKTLLIEVRELSYFSYCQRVNNPRHY